MKKFITIAAIFGFLGVAFGAFGAHGLRSRLSDHHYDSYRTGVQYLFYHIPVLLYLGTCMDTKLNRVSGWLFLVGIICFTGSNILMTTEAVHHINMHMLWPITPIGGLLMLSGWACLIVQKLKN